LGAVCKFLLLPIFSCYLTIETVFAGYPLSFILFGSTGSTSSHSVLSPPPRRGPHQVFCANISYSNFGDSPLFKPPLFQAPSQSPNAIVQDTSYSFPVAMVSALMVGPAFVFQSSFPFPVFFGRCSHIHSAAVTITGCLVSCSERIALYHPMKFFPLFVVHFPPLKFFFFTTLQHSQTPMVFGALSFISVAQNLESIWCPAWPSSAPSSPPS